MKKLMPILALIAIVAMTVPADAVPRVQSFVSDATHREGGLNGLDASYRAGGSSSSFVNVARGTGVVSVNGVILRGLGDSQPGLDMGGGMTTTLGPQLSNWGWRRRGGYFGRGWERFGGRQHWHRPGCLHWDHPKNGDQIPEPGTLSLLGAGLMSLIPMARRKKNKKNKVD